MPPSSWIVPLVMLSAAVDRQVAGCADLQRLVGVVDRDRARAAVPSIFSTDPERLSIASVPAAHRSESGRSVPPEAVIVPALDIGMLTVPEPVTSVSQQGCPGR